MRIDQCFSLRTDSVPFCSATGKHVERESADEMISEEPQAVMMKMDGLIECIKSHIVKSGGQGWAGYCTITEKIQTKRK